MAEQIGPLTPLVTPPDPPSRLDPANFGTQAELFLGQFGTMFTSLNTFVTEVNRTTTNMVSGVYATSSTSLAIGTGSKSFTCTATRLFYPGMFIRAVDLNNPATNYMEGYVTSYDAGTGALVMNVITTFGSGTVTSWAIGASSPIYPTIGTGPDQVPTNAHLGSAAFQDIRYLDFSFTTSGATSMTTGFYNIIDSGTVTASGVAADDFALVTGGAYAPFLSVRVQAGSFSVYGLNPSGSTVTIPAGTTFYVRVMKRIP